MPKFKLQEIEDFYTYYVQILEVPEDVFWHADFPFLKRVVANKSAYDGWLKSVIEKERERYGKFKK